MSTNSQSDVERRVLDVIARTFSLPAGQVDAGVRMGNPPAWDSVGHMGLIFELEQEFGVTFPTYQIVELQTVPAIVEAVASQSAA